MNTKLPLISVIIANWNGGDVMMECLKSLSKLNVSKYNLEVIIIDNGSTDGSLELINKFRLPSSEIKLIRNKSNLGFAPANNQGVKEARGKYVLLLNNDTKVTPNFLTTLVEKMESDQNIGVIQPKIVMMDKPDRLDNAGGFLTRIGFIEHRGFGEKDSEEFNQECEIFTAKGACMLIAKSLIDKINLFDPDFISYFEETDFCWRVWLSGKKIIYLPQARILHKVGFTIKRLDVGNINYHYYKNRITSLLKNLEIKNLVIILPSHLVISLGISLAFLIRGQAKSSWMIVNAIMWNLVNLNKTLDKRRFVQQRRSMSDSMLFDKFMHPINWNKFFGDFKRVEKDIKRKSS